MSRKPNKFKKQFLSTTLIMLCCLNIAFVSSSERVAGVQQGEWVEYKIEWEGENLPEVYPTRVRREILDSSGSIINVNITIWYSNGTIIQETMTGNVSDGTGASAMIFIPANLTVGDTVHMQGFDDTKIVDETEREYLGLRRKVVYSSFTSKGFHILIYWDKIKGVALEINIKHILDENQKTYDYEIKVNIDGTNMLLQSSNNAPSFDWIFYPILMAIMVSAVLIIQRRRASHKKRLHRRKIFLSRNIKPTFNYYYS
jgi:hypothetical protein